MDNNIRRWIGASICCFIIGGGQGIIAQKVVFPQATQAGVAMVETSENEYTLKNNLLTAKFIKTGDKLFFNGCEEMNLKAGTELFKVVLGDGTTFTSSQMELQSVDVEDLTGKADAVKGSDRFNGKALKAVFTKGNLTITWHAVLRDGSHYLRTTLDITSSADQSMQSITPMIYNVDNEKAQTVPVVVGNTRGALLASDKIFAGLETPMGVNSAKVANAGFDTFTPNNWTSSSFAWEPGEELPEAIRTADNRVDGNPVSAESIRGTRGYVSFRKAGKQTLTFEYTSGNHRLDIVGVDIVDGTGNVLAHDYHGGYTGGQKSNNVYTLDVPSTGAYVLRYFVAGTTRSDFNSNGKITFSEKIGVPVVIYDLVEKPTANAANRAVKSMKAKTETAAASTNAVIYDRTGWSVSVDGWNSDNGTGTAAAIIDGNTRTYWHSDYTKSNQDMPHWFMVDMKKTQTVGSVGFVTRQDAIGVNGHIKNYEIWTGNSETELTKQTEGTLTYSLGEVWVDLPKAVEARYVKVVINSSQNGRKFACCAEFRVASSNPTADVALTTFDIDEEIQRTWTPSSWSVVEDKDIPWRVKEQDEKYPQILAKKMGVAFEQDKGTLTTTFSYSSGNNRLNIVGVDLIDNTGAVVASDYHAGYTGTAKDANVYTLSVPRKGEYTMRMMCSIKTENLTSSGNISMLYTVIDTLHMVAPSEVPMEGYWRRNTTLKKGASWEVSSVVGIVAPGQQRRSFLAYSERERAVPWRTFPIYVSWYELNIDRNNAVGNGGVYNASDPENKNGNYSGNMTSDQCTDVINHWKTSFYTPYKMAPNAFVFDDGWDAYGTWTFNSNFPEGFTPQDKLTKEMGVGIGAWLGPVGGYGGSGTYRRNYWSSRGGMQLSNETYYKYFVDCCNNMIKNYDFRFFKFNGISAQGTAYGPDAGDTGIENAEGIISIERDVRKTRPDIFFNTTVGTWASPFWFHYSDAIWRQDADCSKISGIGTDREQWITYRDYMVYKIFTQGSPLCPINTLMTHGLILSTHGKPYTPSNYEYNGVVREMRCAFGCGSGMVELYTDYDLMDNIANSKGEKGQLWKELADCMNWQKRNADVLPDIHWVGGNPWDGSKVNIYGWAAWNGQKATLTLRNADVKERKLTTTLRKVFDIPEYIKTTITLSSSFADQKFGTSGLQGVDMGIAIDIDKEITFTMPASTVFVLEGIDNSDVTYEATAIDEAQRIVNYERALPENAIGSYANVSAIEAAIAANDASRCQQLVSAYKSQVSPTMTAGFYRLINANDMKYLTPYVSGDNVLLHAGNDGQGVNNVFQFVPSDKDGQFVLKVNGQKVSKCYSSSTEESGANFKLVDTQSSDEGRFSFENAKAKAVFFIAENASTSSGNHNYIHENEGNAVGWTKPDNDGIGQASSWYVVPATEAEVALTTVNDASYATAYLPFNASKVEGAKAYYGQLNDDHTIMNMHPTTGIEAAKGVVLVGQAGAEKATLTIGASDALETSLHGTFNELALTNDTRNNYLVFGVSGGKVGFYAPSSAVTSIGANKAFLYNNIGTSAVSMRFDNVETGITNVVEDNNQQAPIFDLSGRKVNHPTKGGVYIQNGKKVIK